jgi:hypothetical protein
VRDTSWKIGVFHAGFYCHEFGLWMQTSDDCQISSRICTEVGNELEAIEIIHESLNNVGPYVSN